MGFWIFWIFMLLMVLLVPLTMIILGKYFMKKAPKNINLVFGYRSDMSMKNRDTWEYAHQFCGKLWYVLGWITLPVAAVAMLFLLGKNIDTIGMVGGIISLIEVIPMVGAIIPTEIALRKQFDKDGKHRSTRQSTV